MQAKSVFSLIVAMAFLVSGMSVLSFGTLASPSAAGGPSSISVTPGAQVAASHPQSPPVTPGANPVVTQSLLPSTNFNSNLKTVAKSTYLQAAQNLGVPTKFVYIPAAPSKPTVTSSGVVLPGYVQSPAPMGIGAYGIKNVSGTLVPYSYTTTGFNATLNLSSLQAFDISNDAPGAVSIQLNAILTGTTLFGLSNYTFWTQNVLFYDSQYHQFQLVDNIWNFSSPSANGAILPPSTIYSHTAVQYAYPYAYIGVGNVINNVSSPFNVSLYLQSAVVNGMSTVFFNYSFSFTNLSTGSINTMSGVFDQVEFNSFNGLQGYVAPLPVYRVDGGNVTPLGFINYDAEVAVIGPGGGSSTRITAIGGTMTLTYMNGGKYANVPSAYDIGSETGETSTGIAVAWNAAGVATVSAGPSLVYGMWNVASDAGTTAYTGTVSPANSFLFVSPGSFISLDQNGYVPLALDGSYSFSLPTGSYYQTAMLSDHSAEEGALSATESITLSYSSSAGVYTPLYADGNAQLAGISFPGGSGTATSPYQLFNNSGGFIETLFANMNDFGFPVWSGVMIRNTNAHVNLNNSTSFAIQYEMFQPLYYSGFYDVPQTDGLGFVLYNTTNLSVVGADLISSTIPAMYAAGFLTDASFILWNSTHDLIAGNVFSGSGVSLLIYNPSLQFSNNTVTGNYFVQDYAAPVASLGLYLASSGNLIFNNYFGGVFAGDNAFVSPYDPYTGLPAVYLDTWNVTPTLTSLFSYSFNGYTLTGNILGNSTVGGNFWNDYVLGDTLPFTDAGGIFPGGDFAPVYLNTGYYPILFTDVGLQPGTSWSLTLQGYTKSTTTNMIMFLALNGTYSGYAFTAGGYLNNSGTVVVNGTSNEIGIIFVRPITVTVTEANLLPGMEWYASATSYNLFAVYNVSSTGNTITLLALPGLINITYGATSVSYYFFPENLAYGNSYQLILALGDAALPPVEIPAIYNNFTVTSSGLPAGTPWTVDVYALTPNGDLGPLFGSFSSISQSMLLQLPYGYYAFEWYSSGHLSYNSNYYYTFSPYGAYPSGGPVLVASFTTGYAVTISVSGLPSGMAWGINIGGDSNFGNYYYNQTVVTSGSYTIYLPSGQYYYQIIPSNSSYDSPQGTILVNGAPVSVNAVVGLSPTASVSVTFDETGLASGTSWQVTFNGQTLSSTTSSISFTTTPGTYYYQVYSNGSVTPQSSGSLNVQGPMSVDVTFSPAAYTVTFVAAGLPSGKSYSITFDGATVSSSGSVAVFSVPAGTYTYSVSGASGYKLAGSSSSVTVGNNTIVLLQFQSSSASSSTAAVLMDTGLVAIGLVVGGVGVFGMLKLLESRKGKK